MFKVPEEFRVRGGDFRSSEEDGNNGAFLLPTKSKKTKGLLVIASDGLGWEHVSVTPLPQTRCPTWEEMTAVKSRFWAPEDLVVQYMVPASEHVNCHPYCLHLWRKVGTNEFCERPPALLVGGG